MLFTAPIISLEKLRVTVVKKQQMPNIEKTSFQKRVCLLKLDNIYRVEEKYV